MDFMTVFGLLFGLSIVGFSINAGHSWAAFINLHGLALVFGGVMAAAMVNCSARELWAAFRATFTLLRPPLYVDPYDYVTVLVRLAQKARRAGNISIKDEGKDVGDGFLNKAIEICLNSAHEGSARMTLERQVNQTRSRHREVGNVLRTVGLLSPMFGLLGTIIGIVGVLRNMTNPESIGPVMSMALSTGFYGILFANLFCIPMAGKLRTRSLNEAMAKMLITEGVMDVFFTQETSMQIELKMLSFLQGGATEKAPAVKT